MPSAFRRSGSSKRATPSGISGSSIPVSPSSTSPSSSSSSHRTAVAPAFRLRGVKPWQGGSYLTSVGLNDLDSILGGGQVLGTSIVLEEDRLWTRDLAITLVKYWCAEAISQEQHLVIPIFSKPPLTNTSDDDDSNINDPSLSFLFGDGDDSSLSSYGDEEQNPAKNIKDELEDLLSALPRNLHWDKQKKKEEKAKREQQEVEDAVGAADLSSGLGSISLGPITILEEDEEEEDEEEKTDDVLEVAWQYKKSVQQERLAKSKSNATNTAIASNVFCHSYDLSARMIDQTPLEKSSYIAQLPSSPTIGSRPCSSSHTKGYKLFYDLVNLLKERAASDNGKAIRLLLYHPPIETLSIALPLLLAHIRKESLPVVIMICTAPIDDVKSNIRLARSCDVVLSTEGFASRMEYPPPPEFRHLQGVLKITKTTRKRTEIAALIYGFKRDRRKLHIPLLHIPPEDYAEGGGSTSGVRSGAGKPATKSEEMVSVAKQLATRKPSNPGGGGMGCSSNMSGSLLDF